MFKRFLNKLVQLLPSADSKTFFYGYGYINPQYTVKCK